MKKTPMKSSFKPKVGGKVRPTKAKIGKQNTRHGKMDMPFTALNKFGGK